MKPIQHALALLAGAIALVAVLVSLLLTSVVPRRPPAELPAAAPFGPAITPHVALVIVDGLRYDVATDPELMPALSRRMQTATSGEIWASPVSMTSSAILTYATGQRGDLDQIVDNESGKPPPYDDLVHIAKSAGLVTACTGDHAWFKYFPDAWTYAHPDPKGVAIDVDYDDEIFAAAYAHLARAPRPNLYVAHFVTPDHQAHAYGVASERYRRKIHAFDARLDALLEAMPRDTAVFVTSDHGATDTGTHGSDTPVQRRSPILAFGPGIAGGRHDAAPLDQVDLPGTLAALLGVRAPTHGRGNVLVDWLDVDDAERARIACADLARLAAYARTVASEADLEASGARRACAEGSARERIARAKSAAKALDRSIGEPSAGRLGLAPIVPITTVWLALLLAAFAIGRRALPSRSATTAACVVAPLAIALSVFVTHGIERLPGSAPNAARVALYVLAIGGFLLAFALRERLLGWIDRSADHVALAAFAVPGIAVLSETRHTQVASFALALVTGALALGVLDRGAAFGRPVARPRPQELSLALALFAFVAPTAFLVDEFLPRALFRHPSALWLAIATIALFGVHRALRHAARGDGAAKLGATFGVAVAIATLFVRSRAPAVVCLAAWVTLPIAGVVAWRRGARALGELLVLGAYVCVSRDPELPYVAATFLVAEAVGDALASRLAGAEVRRSAVLLVAAFLFGWTFLQRVGVQLGLDVTSLDWGAGAFRDPGASMVRIGAAIVFKHELARAAVLFAVVRGLSAGYRVWVLRALFVTELARAATLAVMLYVCRDSFWTALQVIGDVPHACAAVVVVAAAHAWATISAARAREPSPAALTTTAL